MPRRIVSCSFTATDLTDADLTTLATTIPETLTGLSAIVTGYNGPLAGYTPNSTMVVTNTADELSQDEATAYKAAFDFCDGFPGA